VQTFRCIAFVVTRRAGCSACSVNCYSLQRFHRCRTLPQ